MPPRKWSGHAPLQSVQVSRTNKIRAFCGKISNSTATLAAACGRGSLDRSCLRPTNASIGRKHYGPGNLHSLAGNADHWDSGCYGIAVVNREARRIAQEALRLRRPVHRLDDVAALAQFAQGRL
jgi:hypothetical protein